MDCSIVLFSTLACIFSTCFELVKSYEYKEQYFHQKVTIITELLKYIVKVDGSNVSLTWYNWLLTNRILHA